MGREDERCGSDQDKKTKQNISPEQIITSSRLLGRNLLLSYFRLIREKGEKGPLGASEDIPLSSAEPTNTHCIVETLLSQSTNYDPHIFTDLTVLGWTIVGSGDGSEMTAI